MVLRVTLKGPEDRDIYTETMRQLAHPKCVFEYVGGRCSLSSASEAFPMIDKLDCREFTVGFMQYRVFSFEDQAVAVQVRLYGRWRELQGRRRSTILEYWHDECRQLELFISE